MGMTKFHVTHARPAAHRQIPRGDTDTSDDCRTGKTKFITSPTLGSSISISTPLTVTWDPTCLPSTSAVKILLYAPGTEQYLLHYWDGLDIKRGEYNITVDPSWYGSKPSQQMQLSVVPTDLAFAALLDLPAGPVFTATYDGTATAAAAATPSEEVGSATIVGDFMHRALDAGKIAAAVLLPILFVALCIGAYIKYTRKRAAEQRKEWSEKVDRRMSTISTDWKSVSAAGASAAIRNSMAAGTIRSSVYSQDENRAGVGSNSNTTGVGLRNPGLGGGERQSRVSFATTERQSRVSFADSARPSMERKSRAFHVGHVPPVPALPSVTTSNEVYEREGMSPTQAVGAVTLTPEDIRARIAQGRERREREEQEEREREEEREGMMPALSLMRTGTSPSTDDLLLSPSPASTPEITMPSPVYTPSSAIANAPESAYTTPTSPTMGSVPMPMPMMSPDDMLRAYAERRKMLASPPPTVGGKTIGFPVPAPAQGHKINESVGVGMYGGAKYVVGEDYEDAYGGTA